MENLRDRYRAFGEEVQAIYKDAQSKMGAEDVRYIKRLNWFSRAMEGVGRGLIHFSFEPVGFSAGVLALWVHKQLQTTEIGHTVLHALGRQVVHTLRVGTKEELDFKFDLFLKAEKRVPSSKLSISPPTGNP